MAKQVKRINNKCIPAHATPEPPKKYVYLVEMVAVACYSAIDNQPVYQDWIIGIYTSAEKANNAREAHIQKVYSEYERLPNAEYRDYDVDGYPQYVTLRKSPLYKPTYFKIFKLEVDD